jgi:hypothetical protein
MQNTLFLRLAVARNKADLIAYRAEPSLGIVCDFPDQFRGQEIW